MSTLETDAITAATGTNTDLVLTGKGTGVPTLPAGTKYGGIVNNTKGADVASATTVTVGTDGDYADITGTTGPIGTFTVAAGRTFTYQFDAAPTVTHSATIALAGAVDFVAAAGDRVTFFAVAANTVVEVSRTTVAAASSGGFTLGTEQATTSGTGVTFSSIPEGTTMIVINFEGVSSTGTANMLVTIGDSGGLESSGYVSLSQGSETSSFQMVSSTAAFVIMDKVGGASTMSGSMILTLKDATNFTWDSVHNVYATTISGSWGAGVKSLSAELTQLKIARGTFDAGSINIMYQ